MTQGTPISIVDKLQFWSGKQLPVILQAEAAECGLACLAMVANYHGFRSNLISMRRIFSLSLRGTTLHDLMQYAGALNLSARPLRIELDDLKNLAAPCILHWDLNHFVVLKSATAKSITLHDPAFGERTIGMAEASKHFTGVALELTPTRNFEQQDARPTLKLSDFWSRISGLRKSLLLIFTLSCLLQAFVLAGPYYMQLVIDNVILSQDVSLLTVLAAGFFLILLFEISTTVLRGLALQHLGNLMNVQLAANLFHHLIRLPLQYFEKRHMGDVVSRFGSLRQIKELLTTGVVETIIDGLMAIVTLAMIFFYSATLSAVVLLAVGLYALLRFLTFQHQRNISAQEITTKAEENSNFMESVRGIQTIKLFGAEAEREGQWQNRYAHATNQSIRLGNFTISYNAANRFLFGAENIIVIYLAAKLVMAGGFSTGMLFAFIAYKQQFKEKMANLIEKYIQFKMLGLHFERLADIVLTEKEKLQPDTQIEHRVGGSISLQNVSFRYSDATPNVIKNLSLEIRAGESVAITGPSGCGKSTLVKLMLGLDSPQSGTIRVDGLSLEQLGNSQFRSQIAAVMQDDQLFSGSVADNIAFFEPHLDMSKVIRCAKMAAIHDDIQRMPMRYDSLIGDMGSSLSGGQKQRIILARALYKSPRILFMDEATSHLDSGLERSISDAIKDLDITRVIIAHRQETIASADREISLAAPSQTTEPDHPQAPEDFAGTRKARFAHQ